MDEYGVHYHKLRNGRLQATVGGLTVTTPPMPPLAEFINGHVTDWRQQKWNRSLAYPTQDEIEAMKPAEQDALRAREAGRLLEGGGAWLMLAGKPFYLTPDHYFFLTHFKLPELEYPTFYEADAKDYLWNVGVEADENCIGGVMMGARQRGKTARRAARHLRKAMTTPGVLLGIQSKTDDAARDVLNMFISHALREMSALIRPVTNLATDDAQTEIAFMAPARRGKKALEGPRVQALNSRINRKNSKATAYDSKTVYELFSDEWAKKQDYDTEERLTVVSRMMWARDGKRKGRIWMYSTIDEKEDFEPEMPRRVWDGSDPSERLPNGRTKTGLVRLFISCLEASKVDEFGRNDIAASLAEWEANAPDKASDPIGYRRYCRANPRTPEDGFASANKDSLMNLDALDAARDANLAHFARFGRYLWAQGNLEWEDLNTRERVKWVPSATGRWKAVVEAFPAELNAVRQVGQHTSILGTFPKYQPMQEARNVCGTDTYNARKVARLGTASKGSSYAYWKRDELHERERFDALGQEVPGYWPSDSFFMEYINRPGTPHIFFEDMVKQCHFLGAAMMIENNKDACVAYLEDRGYAGFVRGNTSIVASINAKQDRKKKDEDEVLGFAASTGTAEQLAERMAEFTHGPLAEDLRRMPFNDQIKDVVNFDVTKTKKFDPGMATGYTLLLAKRFRRPNSPPPPRDSYRLSSFFVPMN